MFLSRRTTEAEGPVQALSAADPDERIEALGFEIAVRCWGRGRPVLCLHDVGSGSRDFEAFAAAASDRFEVIALDWPGHGWSPCDGSAPSPLRWARVLEAVVDALHLDAPIVVAHGFGAAVALLAAARGEAGVAALVLCNPAGLAPEPTAGALWRDRLVLAPDSWTGSADRLRRRLRLAAAEGDTGPLIGGARRELAEAHAEIVAAAAAAAAPVWLAWGGMDPAYAFEASRAVCDRFARRSETLFEGAEPPFVEDPARFAEALAEFVGA
jgi:pimeloyl-ACP methyl ester carboxylesterase